MVFAFVRRRRVCGKTWHQPHHELGQVTDKTAPLLGREPLVNLKTAIEADTAGLASGSDIHRGVSFW
jgi:hypothetical protein